MSDAQAAYDQQPEVLTAGSICAFVFGHAILRDDAATARIWAGRLEDSHGFAPDDRWLCSAVVTCAKGFKDEAESLLDQFERFHIERHACGSREFNLYLSQLIRERLVCGTNSPPLVLPPTAAHAELQAPGNLFTFLTSHTVAERTHLSKHFFRLNTRLWIGQRFHCQLDKPLIRSLLLTL